MPTSSVLVLVDPRAQRRSALLQRLASFAIGLAIVVASAIPFLATTGH